MTTVTTHNDLELADIIRQYRPNLLHWFKNLHHTKMRALYDIATCRTSAQGGHVQLCADCGAAQQAYNSCRNRHCPKCLGAARLRWTQAREAELLPVPYFHVVFTVPHILGPLFLQNPRVAYSLLFRASAETLKTVAADPKHLGARIGFLSVLHTWGQKLGFHPHIHCIVPAGGISPDGDEWIHGRPDYLLPVRVLSAVYRAKLLDFLYQAYATGDLTLEGQLQRFRSPLRFKKLLAASKSSNWVVYSKRPFGSAGQVIRYLGAYTHRVALTNGRLVALENDRVFLTYKDYADGGKRKTMNLGAREFLRRFLLHILPRQFMRIRYFGYMSNGGRAEAMAKCRDLLQASETQPPVPLAPTTTDNECDSSSPEGVRRCPECNSTNIVMRDVTRRAFITPKCLYTPEAWDTS